jgi:hypothetical protein
VIVNDVDTDRLRRAARLIRGEGADVTMPAKAVADWLDHVATFTENSRRGEDIPGLRLAGAVAKMSASPWRGWMRRTRRPGRRSAGP